MKRKPLGPIIRMRVAVLFFIGCYAFLCCMLWRIQIYRVGELQANLEEQSIRRVRLPGLRGRILDRKGYILADNRPSYNVALYVEELRVPGSWSKTMDRIEKLVSEQAQALDLEPAVSREQVQKHFRQKLPLPLLLWEDIDETTLARWAEQGVNTPGMDMYVAPVRTYPYASIAAQTLGYIGKAGLGDADEEKFHFYLPDTMGRAGIEKHFDEALRGQPGGMLLRVDVSGFRHSDPELGALRREPQPGQDVILSLDLEVQQMAEEALGTDAGAVVVMDPSNGDILAAASQPSYNLNHFVGGVSREIWQALLADEGKPLLNRVFAGTYAPGSTFKPVVAIAGLEQGYITPDTTQYCPGYVMLGGIRFQCAHSRSHGDLAMQEALKLSCNVFFFKLGMDMGHEPIWHMASALGFGHKTGVAIDHEAAGLLPDDAWMRTKLGHGWRTGDTLNLAIGQGSLTVTPLQLASAIAAIANGGTVYRPRLVLGLRPHGKKTYRPLPPVVENDMHWSRESLDVVRRGMRDVIMSNRGTGRRARIDGVSMAGKTGTAEYGRKGDGKYRGWMVAFAPYEKPAYVIAMVLDDASSGGGDVGPRLGELMAGLFLAKERGQG